MRVWAVWSQLDYGGEDKDTAELKLFTSYWKADEYERQLKIKHGRQAGWLDTRIFECTLGD